MHFENRQQAAKLLAKKLLQYKDDDVVILALPRGGVPVALEIAKTLKAPMSILAVRKIGAPFNPELALGAICEDAAPIFNKELLLGMDLNPQNLEYIVKQKRKEIGLQIKKFRSANPLPDLSNKVVIVVDDGLATGATVLAAVSYLKDKNIAKIVVAVPIAAASSADKMRKITDDFIALEESSTLMSIGQWYDDFSQVSDSEVVELLNTNLTLTL